ncbi:MarR family winged helix-turn-helix transcriptional regulator [Microbacterium hominis]|uniref:MarR family transcriptional regulator n=1 Tax=Microbacterium hominis TaxID=162426 RepID=A0A7D4UB47_9MICO|nr:MarR family transcriptional regulator [Microbacterium hominis]QKJ19143.1 MarR family transcriptional regulator [Microbacterium hominis]
MSEPYVAEAEFEPRTTHDRAVMGVLQAVRAFSDAMDRMNGGMKGDMEMNATDLAALRMLIMREQRGDAVSPHDLATHLRISTASTTKMLDRLTESGHVRRRPHPTDRRARIVVLTDESRRTFFHHFGARLQEMRLVAIRYTDDELAVIARFLAEMGEAIDPPGA